MFQLIFSSHDLVTLSPIHDKLTEASGSDMENKDTQISLSDLDFKEFNEIYQKMDNAKNGC
jgi:hypothetical protein